MIKFVHKGNFNNTERFFGKVRERAYLKALNKYGQAGVDALASATPKRSGATAASWSYEVSASDGGYSISWSNSNVNKGVNIALIIQYGHGTGTGGYVQGIDYINPAIRPIFEKLADEAWQEVTS